MEKLRNPIVENFISNNGYALMHLYIPDSRLYSYDNVVIYGLDDGAKAIFTSAIQFGLKITAFCDAFSSDFSYWNLALDYIPTVTHHQAALLPNCAILCSKEIFDELQDKKVGTADIYVADRNLNKNKYGGANGRLAWELNSSVFKKPIVIFGTGEQGRIQAEIFQDEGVEIFAFCDNNTDKQKNTCIGKRVISPDELKSIVGEVFVVCAVEEWEPVYRQTTGLGFCESDIYVNTVRACHFKYILTAIDRRGLLMRDTLSNVIVQYIHGKHIADILGKGSGENFLLLPRNSLGDIVICLAFLSEYKKAHGLDRVTCIVSQKRKQIAEMFIDADAYLFLTKSELTALWDYLYLTGNSKVIRIAYLKRKTWFLDFWHSCGEDGVSLIDELRHALGVKAYNVTRISVNGKIKAGVIPNSILLIKSGPTKDLFGDDFGDSQYKSLMSAIIGELERKGICVYTNISNSRDFVFPGTKPFEATILELVEAADSFKCIIAMPTGIGELLALTGCNMVSIFPESLEVHRLALDRFANRDNAVTVSWHKGQEAAAVDMAVRIAMRFEPIVRLSE